LAFFRRRSSRTIIRSSHPPPVENSVQQAHATDRDCSKQQTEVILIVWV
jgi:hypothetical protein